MFAHLGEETWGQRLRRAREASLLTVRATAEQLTAAGFDVSHTTIARFEDEDEAPRGGHQRAVIACVAVLAYGYDPADFDLEETAGLLNIPAVLDRLSAAAATIASSRWSGVLAGQGSYSTPDSMVA